MSRPARSTPTARRRSAPRNRARDKRAVVEKDDQRRGHHHLLCAHAEEARRDARGIPGMPRRTRGRRAPDEGVQGEQVEEPHERFRALDDVGDRLGEQGVEGPQECRGEAEACRPGALRRGQRSPEDPEQDQCGEDMYADVCDVIAPDVRPAHGMVDRERQVQDGTTAHGRARGGPERRSQVLEGRVVRNGRVVVEEERDGERPAVGRRNSRGQRAPEDPRRPVRPGNRARGYRPLFLRGRSARACQGLYFEYARSETKILGRGRPWKRRPTCPRARPGP